jgi:hypothetical protein
MLMSLVLTKVQRWLTYRETVRELESLSERECRILASAVPTSETSRVTRPVSVTPTLTPTLLAFPPIEANKA